MRCNCCGCDNAPMAWHENYLICDDCVERFGSYDAATYICIVKKAIGYDQIPQKILDNLDEEYNHYKKMNFKEKEEN